MVILVGAAVLPRRAAQPREGFPWFWLSFPTAVFLVAEAPEMTTTPDCSTFDEVGCVDANLGLTFA